MRRYFGTGVTARIRTVPAVDGNRLPEAASSSSLSLSQYHDRWRLSLASFVSRSRLFWRGICMDFAS